MLEQSKFSKGYVILLNFVLAILNDGHQMEQSLFPKTCLPIWIPMLITLNLLLSVQISVFNFFALFKNNKPTDLDENDLDENLDENRLLGRKGGLSLFCSSYCHSDAQPARLIGTMLKLVLNWD